MYRLCFFLFLSLKIDFASASNTEPDEMSHYAVCQSKVYLLKRFPELKRKHNLLNLRDLFHVYLNRYDFQFLRLYILNKTKTCCFFIYNRRVPGIAK